MGSDAIKIKNNFNRITLYDQIRFWATILVVIGHSTYLEAYSELVQVEYSLPDKISSVYYSDVFEIWRTVQRWIYGFHMPLFFVLSGALFVYSVEKNIKDVFISKVKRLVVPYFVWGYLFMLPVKYLAGFYDRNSLKEAYKIFWRARESGHLWFLLALFWCMIYMYVVVNILERIKLNNTLILCISAICFRLISIYFPVDILDTRTALSYYPYFVLGFWFEKNIREKLNMKIVALGGVLVAIIETLRTLDIASNKELIVLSGCILVILFAYFLDRFSLDVYNKRWWKIIVRNLFYVYLIHDPLEYVILKIFIDKRLLVSGVGCVTYALLRTIGIFVVSVIIGELVQLIWNKVFYRLRNS